MAQDFYLKAQALHEEFQKKELQYLKAERKLNTDIMWKKDLNLPLQEYLQRINQREKETEETYKNILKQMDELDQHTDVLSLKLEKLGILQATVTTATTSNWLQSLDLNVGSNYPTLSKHSIYATDVIPLSVKSVSTQTEYSMCCEKCNSPMLTNNQPSYLLENLSSSNPHLSLNGKTETVKTSDHSNLSNLLNENQNISQYIQSKYTEHMSVPVNHKIVPEENLKTKQVEEKNLKQTPFSGMEFAENRDSSFESLKQIDNGFITENLKNIENLHDSQSVINEKNCHTKAADAEFHKEICVSKSDVDSMNNEFDFLESDTSNAPVATKMKIEQSVKSNKSLTNDGNVISEARQSQDFQLNLKEKQQRSVPPNSKLNAANDESETSASLSGFNSPHISVASDSDGVCEKESPFTASAAYQALLGNSVQTKKTPKNVSDSESEDEVENALASAVQRNHLKSKSFVKQTKEETSSQPANTKPLDKASKLTSANRPQSKLSKSTRKVLGLDSSSGSEVEMAISSPQAKKIDEDSDEFGFYD